jgi:hypothetical protein
MTQTRTLSTAASVALGAGIALSLAASSAVAKEPELLRLTAFALDLNSGARTATVDIVIERWSTPEEISGLKAVLVEKGDDMLLSALQKIRPRCGYAHTSTSLSWDINFARETDLPDGSKKIVVASDRPVGVWEARNNGRSMDYQFSLAEIRFSKDGKGKVKGKGKAIPRAQVSYNKEKDSLEIENWDREPVRLNDVKIVQPKEEKKK